MRTSQAAVENLSGRHGSLSVGLAELRRGLASPFGLSAANRQRLLDLARRAARVQRLGGAYRRVSLSATASAAIVSAAAAS